VVKARGMVNILFSDRASIANAYGCVNEDIQDCICAKR
jgi:hypothetical protein